MNKVVRKMLFSFIFGCGMMTNLWGILPAGDKIPEYFYKTEEVIPEKSLTLETNYNFQSDMYKIESSLWGPQRNEMGTYDYDFGDEEIGVTVPSGDGYWVLILLAVLLWGYLQRIRLTRK